MTETKIAVHRFSGKFPIRVSITRGKRTFAVYLADDDAERLRGILAEAVHAEKEGWKGELKAE